MLQIIMAGEGGNIVVPDNIQMESKLKCYVFWTVFLEISKGYRDLRISLFAFSYFKFYLFNWQHCIGIFPLFYSVYFYAQLSSYMS